MGGSRGWLCGPRSHQNLMGPCICPWDKFSRAITTWPNVSYLNYLGVGYLNAVPFIKNLASDVIVLTSYLRKPVTLLKFRSFSTKL